MAGNPSGPGDGGFVTRTGDEPPGAFASDRSKEVAKAWESLLQIRRLVQPDHPDLPAPWERAQLLRAVSLGLEAAGIGFATVDDEDVVVDAGVVLRPEEPGWIRVTWRHRRGERPVDAGEADLAAAAAALGRAGWDALLYRAGRTRYLRVEPGRVEHSR